MAYDSTVVLQSVSRMFDRLAAQKSERRQEALQMMQIGLQERKFSMMEEVRNLQVDQSRMQIAMFKLADMEKMTNVDKAKIANKFSGAARFLDFYNPEDPSWAETYNDVLIGKYKKGVFADKQGWNFSQSNASRISSALMQAHAGHTDGIISLIDRAQRASLNIEMGKKISFDDKNLLNGLLFMGMYNLGEDSKGKRTLYTTPEWEELMSATQNILSNESKIRKERIQIQSGDYKISEKLSFLEYEELPDINQSMNEIDLQLLVDRFVKKDDEVDPLGGMTPGQIERQDIEESIHSTSDRVEQLNDKLSTDEVKFNMMKMNRDKFGYAIDQLELEKLSTDIRDIKDSLDVLHPQLITLNEERELAAEKIFLEVRNIPATEENIDLRRSLIEQQRRQYVTQQSELEYQRSPRP